MNDELEDELAEWERASAEDWAAFERDEEAAFAAMAKRSRAKLINDENKETQDETRS